MIHQQQASLSRGPASSFPPRQEGGHAGPPGRRRPGRASHGSCRPRAASSCRATGGRRCRAARSDRRRRAPRGCRGGWGFGLAVIWASKQVCGEVSCRAARRDLVADDRLDGRPADHQRAAVVVCGPDDRLGGDLGLEDRGTGFALRGRRLLTQPNCGVFRAGIWTIVSRTRLSSWISSQWSESQNPWIACLAAQ